METSPASRRRASALLTVVMLTAALAILTASMLSYSLNERRGNERNRLVLRAKNMSENISAYGAEQITTKLYRLRSPNQIAFMGSNALALPPSNVLLASDTTYTSGASTMQVYAGLTGSTGLTFINPATSPNDPNAGLQVNTGKVPIIAKGTAYHSALGAITAYTQLDLAVDFIPLFQFAVFYNMDMEIWPGADMVIRGPVHCNGELSARSATGFTATIQFTDRVSSSKGFYANSIRQGTWINNSGGTDAGPGGDGPLQFQHSSTGTVTAIKSASNVWRDHKYGAATETTTTQNNFKVFATNTYGVNLRTSVHGVTSLVLPSVSDYAKTDNPATADDERNNGRQVIAAPAAADTSGLKETKIGRKAGLYIIVNPDNETRNGVKPDGTTVSMRARSYRCWLNTVNADLSHTLYEVVLPGQPSYGANNANDNNLPNAYRSDTSIGHNQVLRTIYNAADPANTGYDATTTAITGFSDAYFYDLRRARNNSGAGSQLSSGSYRSGNPYTPRPIVKIDFDLTRFRMAVERTLSGVSASHVATDTASTVYNPNTPSATNWASSIYNPSAAAASYNLGLGASFNTFPTSSTLAAPDPYRIYFAPSNPADPLIATNPGVFAVGGSDLANPSASGLTTPRPWYDGVTVYIHSVDAEYRGDDSNIGSDTSVDADTDPDRIDSAVRLWNGRGPIVSLPGASYSNMTGFTFATNDAAYIVGHFNADGTIHTASGNHSSRYPDGASEMLTSVMADAITILSAPVYNTSYVQTSGWNDSLSAHRVGSSNWIAAWATTQPSGSNSYDGINTGITPAPLPNRGSASFGGGATSVKFGASVTEVSTCLLVGIVPTNHNPTGLTDGPPSGSANGQASGGVHNFPRLLEVWGTSGLYIRGSMVAMFESRVAMEPWNLRIYSAPGRYWGLHENLRNVNHDLPLEPILLGARRLGFKEITAAQYNAMKTAIQALPGGS